MKLKISLFFFLLIICFTDGKAQYSFPVAGKSLNNVTSAFGPRSKDGGDYPASNYNYDFHAAIDIGANQGTNVYPIMDGTIEKIIQRTNTDERIYIKHTVDTYTFLICYYHVEIDDAMYEGKQVTGGTEVIATIKDYYPYGSYGGDHLDIRYLDRSDYDFVDEATWTDALNPGAFLTNDFEHFSDRPIFLDGFGYTMLPFSTLSIDNDIGAAHNNQTGKFIQFAASIKRTEVDLEWAKIYLSGWVDYLLYTEMDLLRDPETTADNRNIVDYSYQINCGDITIDSDVGHNSKSVGIYPHDLGSTETYHDVYFRWYINESLWTGIVNPEATIEAQDLYGFNEYNGPEQITSIPIIEENPSTCNNIVFSPTPKSYQITQEYITFDIFTDLNINNSDGEWLVYNKGTPQYPPSDITDDIERWHGYNDHLYLWPGVTIIKAAVIRYTSADSYELLTDQCEVQYTVDQITGIEDYIWIYRDETTTSFITNTLYSTSIIQEKFEDNSPEGDYITEWEPWRIYANTGCEDILVSEAVGFWINDLPEGYNWERNISGNVIATASIGGVDNRGIHHYASTEIFIEGVPNTFINSGTLLENTVWCGNIDITGTITVPAGKTLTIKPLSNIRFLNSSSLKVYGILEFESGPPTTLDFISSNSGNGIYCYQGSNVNINNAIIKNGYYGVKCIDEANVGIYNTTIDNVRYGVYASWSAPIINNTTISNTYFGVRASYATPNVENCIITNSNYGIYVYKSNMGTNDAVILNNNINSITYYGIYLYNSGGTIRGNEISNCSRGIYCNYLSSPYLGEVDYYGNNKIYDNSYGIYAYNNSDPFLGRNSCTVQGGNNESPPTSLFSTHYL